jgi:hypothetical protein
LNDLEKSEVSILTLFENNMNFKHFETDLERENEYPKLVRDNIPEIVEKLKGKKVKTRILEDDKEYLRYLLHKVEE